MTGPVGGISKVHTLSLSSADLFDAGETLVQDTSRQRCWCDADSVFGDPGHSLEDMVAKGCIVLPLGKEMAVTINEADQECFPFCYRREILLEARS